MSNTFTSLVADVYSSLDTVSRELVGFIPAVTRDAKYERAAVGQVVRSFVAPASTASNITPAVTPPNDGDQTIGQVPLTISKAMRVPIRWNGEETRGLNNNGAGQKNIQRNQVAQAIRTLCNLIEVDLGALQSLASRASGSPATPLFATNLKDPANVRKILSDNGAPMSDLQMIIDTSSGAAMRTLTQLTKANEAADVSMLRQGMLLDIHGFAIRESAQVVQTPAVGTGTAYTTTAAGFAVGTTSIPLITGSGTILAGDIVTFAGDTNQYVVATGIAAPGTLVIAAPGLQKAMSAATKAVTILASANRSMAFARSAIVLAQRLPALPDGGDMAVDRTTVIDERSGLMFEIAAYAQYRQMQYEISCAWGTAMVKPEHCALLIS
jgi:hypothetical protein